MYMYAKVQFFGEAERRRIGMPVRRMHRRIGAVDYATVSATFSMPILLGIQHGDAAGGVTGKFPKRRFGRMVIAHHDGDAAVASFADALYQWYLSEKGNIIFLGQPATAILSEDIILVVRQFRRGEIAHIFHEADDRYFQLRLTEHGNPLFRIGQCDVLGGRDDDHAGYGYGLHQRQMDIPGTRRHIDDQVIKLVPSHVRYELSCLIALLAIGVLSKPRHSFHPRAVRYSSA